MSVKKSSSSTSGRGRSGGARKTGSGGRRRGGRGGRGRGQGSAYAKSPELTSHPTTRNAYLATREWLLKQYGPICAYCGTRHAPSKMTLDHVAPRRGQTAYDRRDNLVLACQPCNQAKKDQAPLAFLLGMRSRAVNLVRYGAHLSVGLLNMARELVPGHLLHAHDAHHPPHPPHARSRRERFGETHDDGDSPYKS